MTLTDKEVLDVLTKEFDEDDEVKDHFNWYRDNKNLIQCEVGFHAINFFERSIGKSFDEEDFAVDIKINLLSCAVDKLQEFFGKKSNQVKYPEIFLEVFYKDPERISEIIYNEGIKLGYWEKTDKAPEKICEIHDLNVQIPKLKLQWLIFVVFYTKDFIGKDLAKSAQRHLKLRKIKTKVVVDYGIINEALEKTRNFATVLKKYETAKYDGYNLSLNLYYFNKITTLYDLAKIFYGNKNEDFLNGNLSRIKKLEGLAVKHSFIRRGDFGDILVNESSVQKYNRIFKLCNDMLRSIFEEAAVEENYDLPNEVATAYMIFKSLHNDTTYSDVLLQDFMLLKDMDLQLGSQDYENFFLLYKELYEKKD